MISVDNLGDGFYTFPQFQKALREYEADLAKPKPKVGDTVTVTPGTFVGTSLIVEMTGAALKARDMAEQATGLRDVYLGEYERAKDAYTAAYDADLALYEANVKEAARPEYHRWPSDEWLRARRHIK